MPNMRARYPHQEEAVTAAISALRQHKRATVVMACGSGKTAVGAGVAFDLHCRTVVLLVPTLALIRQTRDEWQTQYPDAFEYLCVCSDESAVEDDSPSAVAGLPVTTDAVVIRRFLRGHGAKLRLVISTYMSAKRIAQAGVSLDLIIFDEAHKTTGKQGKPYALLVSEENVESKHRLFLTATPRHYKPGRIQGTEETLVYSMHEQETYGPIAYTLPFIEAVRRGIIVDYRVIICVLTNKDLEAEFPNGVGRKRNSQVAHLAIKKAMARYPITKAISFHSSVVEAKSFCNEEIPGVRLLHVNGKMDTEDRHARITEFATSTKAVISNARCLTEGVDIPATDLVVFTSPRRSLVDVIQATGRAMRKSPGKTLGFVLIPILVEDEEVLEDALQNSKYSYLWEVLRALQESDDVLADIVTELVVSADAETETARTRRRMKLDIFGSVNESSFEVAIVRRLGRLDDEMLGQFEEYVRETAQVLVPETSHPRLHRWVSRVRHHKKLGLLPTTLISRLDALGFNWEVTKEDAKEYYRYRARRLNLKRLAEFMAVVESTGRAPSTGTDLGAWGSKIRQAAKKGGVDTKTLEQLNAVGFFAVPKGPDGFQRKQMEVLREFAKTGDVTGKLPKNIAIWLRRMHLQASKGGLEISVKSEIESIMGYSLDLDRRTLKLKTRVEEILKYIKKYGKDPTTNRNHGGIHATVRDLKRGDLKLPKDLHDRLTEAGFVWHPSLHAVPLADNKALIRMLRNKVPIGNICARFHCKKQEVFDLLVKLAVDAHPEQTKETTT